jgi:putative DNA primase/helicase
VTSGAQQLRNWLSEAPDLGDRCTDTATARKFAQEHGADVRFCYARKRWATFTGQRWEFTGQRWEWDEGDRIIGRAKATGARLLREAAAEVDTQTRKRLTKWAEYTLSGPGLRRMLELAQSELPIAADAFDRDPDVLNTPSGTVHLPTGELRPHRREDFLTRMTGATYDPTAQHPVFTGYLDKALPDAATRAYVQRAAGYSITGHASEESAFLPHGPTGSGKTTFLEAVRMSLGDYAAAADFDTLAPRKHPGGPREDLARLVDGVRFVSVSETPPGRRLAVGLMKIIAGRDPLVVRRLYENSVERVPIFKVWVAGNVRPPAPADDDAIWRRLKEIPFTMALAAGERDPAVKVALTDPAQAGPAVLAWLVQGAGLWYADKLGTAPAVEAATADYRRSMDLLGAYLDTATVADPLGCASVGELRAGLERWARDEGIHSTLPDGRAVAAALRGRGCTEKRRHGGERGWLGVRLRTADDPDHEAQEPHREVVRAW